MTHLQESETVENELAMGSGCADTFTFFVDEEFNVKLFTYLGSHFIMNTRKTVSGHYYAWITHIGESELAKDFTVEMTLGKDGPTRIHHRGKVFPISASWEDIRNETNGVLIFANVPNGPGFFMDDGDDNITFEIFVEFLRPIKKDERDKDEADNKTTSFIKRLTYDFENEQIMYGDEVVKLLCEFCSFEIPLSDFKQHVKTHSWAGIVTPELEDIDSDSDALTKNSTKEAYPGSKSNVGGKGSTTIKTSSNRGGGKSNTGVGMASLPIKCNKCRVIKKDTNSLADHIKKVHEKVAKDKFLMKCPQCTYSHHVYSLSREYNIYLHLNDVHYTESSQVQSKDNLILFQALDGPEHNGLCAPQHLADLLSVLDFLEQLRDEIPPDSVDKHLAAADDPADLFCRLLCLHKVQDLLSFKLWSRFPLHGFGGIFAFFTLWSWFLFQMLNLFCSSTCTPRCRGCWF